MRVALPGMPVLDERSLLSLPPAARDFLRGFGSTQPGGVEPSAFYAAQAAEVLLGVEGGVLERVIVPPAALVNE